LNILEKLEKLIEVTKNNITTTINMPITVFGKAEKHDYHNPIILNVRDTETAEKVAATIAEALARHQRPVIEKQDSPHPNPLPEGEGTL